MKTRNRLRSIWHNVRQRCGNPRDKGFKWYGARGISVCPEWQDFEAFKAWAHANGYRDDLTIDRKDNEGHYTPENCRWASILDQERNRRNNDRITFRGETHCLSAWAERAGMSQAALWARIYKRGWPIERALTEAKVVRP